MTSFHTTMVLTQLWNMYIDGNELIRFPYHYGSYATIFWRFSIGCWLVRFHTTMVLTQHVLYMMVFDMLWISFHTTMVLTQHFIAGLNYTIPLRFPYHYGSYATGTQLRRKNSCVDVSIPLWFLRNPDLLEGSWPDSLSVSIPLWFLRNRFYYKDIIQVLGRQNQPTGKIP